MANVEALKGRLLQLFGAPEAQWPGYPGMHLETLEADLLRTATDAQDKHLLKGMFNEAVMQLLKEGKITSQEGRIWLFDPRKSLTPWDQIKPK